MKIVKQHKNRSAYSESFGIYSGKTLADIPFDVHTHAVSHGGLNDQIDYIKIGNTSHDAFLWFDNIDELKPFADKLLEIANEHERRKTL